MNTKHVHVLYLQYKESGTIRENFKIFQNQKKVIIDYLNHFRVIYAANLCIKKY